MTQMTQIRDPNILEPTERDPRTYAIIGAAMEVHSRLGCGFLEAVYQEALAIELRVKGVPFEREPELLISYRGETLLTKYRPDFICYGSVVVELKALDRLSTKRFALTQSELSGGAGVQTG
jgi:GxxExxY protein